MRTEGTLLAGRYRVVRHLGSGGMASVVLCDDERLGRSVAVKRLHAAQPGEMEQRFAREARLGASLNHPNLVAIYDTADRRRGRADRHGVRGGRVALAGAASAGRSNRAARGADGLRARRRPRPRPLPRGGPPRREARERAAARGRRHEAGRPRDRHRRRPDPDHPQRHRARHRRVHGARAARRRRGRPGRPTCTRSPPSASRRWPGGGPARGGRRWRSRGAIATEPPPDLRDHLPDGRPRPPPTCCGAVSRAIPLERPASAGELGSELRARARTARAEPTWPDAPDPQRRRLLRRRRAPRPPGRWLGARRWPARSLAVAAATVALLAAGGGGDDGRQRPARRRRARPSSRLSRPSSHRPDPPDATEPAPAGAGARTRGERLRPEHAGLRADAGGPLRRGRAGAPAGRGHVARGQPRHRVRLRALQPRQVAERGRATRRRRSPTSRSA